MNGLAGLGKLSENAYGHHPKALERHAQESACLACGGRLEIALDIIQQVPHLRVAIYARTSADSTTDIEKQISACKSYAAEKGWSVVAVSYDFTKPEQPGDGLLALLRDANDNRLHAVLTPTIGCLSHDPDELVRLGRALRSSGVVLATLDLGIWDITPVGKSRKRKSREIRLGLKDKAASGDMQE